MKHSPKETGEVNTYFPSDDIVTFTVVVFDYTEAHAISEQYKSQDTLGIPQIVSLFVF
jgi:hypothetical protein